MAVDKRPYWMIPPSKKVMDRIKKIAGLIKDIREITVRRITYMLYPGVHGKDLENRYNTTCKDVVRGRILRIIPWKKIRESRCVFKKPIGYDNVPDFFHTYENVKLHELYSRDKTPCHRRDIIIWFEKDTVIDEFKEVCEMYHIPYICGRGQATWTIKQKMAVDEITDETWILYFGDNDDKGIEIYQVIKRDINHLGKHPVFRWCMMNEDIETRYGLPSESRLDGLDFTDLKREIIRAVIPYIDVDEYIYLLHKEIREMIYLMDFHLVAKKKSLS